MISKRIVLKFPNTMVNQPIVYNLSKQFNLEFNILKASVTPREEGLLVLGLKGRERDFQKGLDYLKRKGIRVQPLSQDIIRNEDKCTHCGVCVTICPTDALTVDMKTRKIIFTNENCIACEHCVPACPPRAMEIHY